MARARVVLSMKAFGPIVFSFLFWSWACGPWDFFWTEIFFWFGPRIFFFFRVFFLDLKLLFGFFSGCAPELHFLPETNLLPDHGLFSFSFRSRSWTGIIFSCLPQYTFPLSITLHHTLGHEGIAPFSLCLGGGGGEGAIVKGWEALWGHGRSHGRCHGRQERVLRDIFMY